MAVRKPVHHKNIVDRVADIVRAVGEIEHRRNQNMRAQFQGRLHTLAKPKSPSKRISDSHDRR